MKLFLKIVGVVLALVLVLALLGFAWLYRDTHRTPREAAEYVALGSSFASGPGVGRQDPESPHLCLRSADNYPHLLAGKRHLQLRDMTCSAATTKHVLLGGQFLQGPQVDALDVNTRLVTVTVGGNDISYMADLFVWSCRNGAEKLPFLLRQGVCSLKPDNQLEQKLPQLAASLGKIADVVHERSPNAQLIFVDYTTVLPEVGNCPERLSISDEELERTRNVAAQLHRVTEEVAQQKGSMLISAEISQNHDVCSTDPWVFGWEFSVSTYGWGPMAYHPNEKAMQAIAEVIDVRLNAAVAK